MPNYRYHTQESDRRNYCCGHSQNMTQRPSCSQNTQRPSCSSSVTSVTSVPTESNPAAAASCAVGCKTDPLKDLAIAMAYVPWQIWRNIYDPEKALCRGTIFQDLDQPFCGAGGVRK